MILEIFSKYGRLEAIPLTLQNIETQSILAEHASEKPSTEFAVDAGPVDAVCCEDPGESSTFVDYPTDQ